MAAEFFGISIKTTLDTSDIQGQLKAISSKLEPIKLKIDIDDTALKTIRTFNTEMQKLKQAANDTGKQLSSSIAPNTKQSQREIDGLKNSISQMGDTQKKAVDDITRAQNKQKQTLSDVTRGWQKLNQEVRNYNKQGQVEITQRYGRPESEDVLTVKKTPDDRLISHSVSENHLKNLKREQTEALKAQQATDQLTAAQERLRTQLVQMEKQGRVTSASMSRVGSAIDSSKSIQELDRLDSMLKRVNSSSKASEQVNRAQGQFEVNRHRLETGLTGSLSAKHSKEMESIASQYNNLNKLSPNLQGQIQNLSRQFQILSVDVNKADQGMARFVGQTGAALLRVPIYAASVAALYAPLNALGDAFRQIIELDTQMTVLERVSNGAIQMNDALEDSIGIAERLGNTISQVNDGMIEFARQGYRGEDLSAITEVATMMGNVSDLTIGDSASALTAAMKGFNIEAEDAIGIVDQLNEVDNNYSVTTTQLAQSIQKSAGAAGTYGKLSAA